MAANAVVDDRHHYQNITQACAVCYAGRREFTIIVSEDGKATNELKVRGNKHRKYTFMSISMVVLAGVMSKHSVFHSWACILLPK